MDGLASWDTAFNAMKYWPDAGYIPRHIKFDEFGQAIPTATIPGLLAFTGTYDWGTVDTFGTCDDWTSSLETVEGGKASAYRAFGTLNVITAPAAFPHD